MMKHTISSSNITLPLLIAYIAALLPSLAARANTQVLAEHNESNKALKLLWVVENKAEKSALKIPLSDNQLTRNTAANSHQETGESLLSTVPLTLFELTKQPLPERYELACFWLPTLSEELLQQYVPLLMRYRDLYAAHLLIALDSAIDLRAYGFTALDVLSEQASALNTPNSMQSPLLTSSLPIPVTLWQFNLYDYKPLPNWLNADYWANPENWGKQRW